MVGFESLPDLVIGIVRIDFSDAGLSILIYPCFVYLYLSLLCLPLRVLDFHLGRVPIVVYRFTRTDGVANWVYWCELSNLYYLVLVYDAYHPVSRPLYVPCNVYPQETPYRVRILTCLFRLTSLSS